MAKTVSLEALQAAMLRAEMNWQADTAMATYQPLTIDEFAQLRRGEKVTIVHRYWTPFGSQPGRYTWIVEVYRATVTKVHQYGYTDLKGMWCRDADPDERVRADLAACGHPVGTLTPNWTVNYKTVEGYSNNVRTADLNRTQVYRGWEVQVEPAKP